MLLFASLLLCTYHKNLACLFFATINKRIYNQEITTLPKRFSFHLHYLICFIYICTDQFLYGNKSQMKSFVNVNLSLERDAGE